MSDFVKLVEVGPRDGLQNQPQLIPTNIKLELIQRLGDCGLSEIEASSFVSPKWVPQLADAAQVLAGLQRKAGVRYPVLVPNMQGLERALAAGAREIAVFTAASEAFNQRNINCDIATSLERIAPVVAAAQEQGVPVRGYVSCVLGCPYQGAVPVAEVVRVRSALRAMGCSEISLGDTIGVGTPQTAAAMFSACAEQLDVAELAIHFHDTNGRAMDNVHACLALGARIVDSAVGGLGGCPYAEGASGNLSSERLVEELHAAGFETGVDLAALQATGVWINAQINAHSQAPA